MENNDKLDIISVSSIVKWTYSIGAVGAMALEYASVILKAKIFDSIASGVTSLKFLFIPILFFTLTKFSKIFLNHAQSFFKSNINIKNFEENSKKLVPLKIWKSDLHKGQALYQTLINYIPTHLNSVLSVPVAILQIIFILSVFLFQVISTQFYWALLSFPIIIGLSYASKFVYSKEFSESISRLNLQRKSVATWIESFFRANKELSLNWSKSKEKNSLFEYKKKIISNFSGALEKSKWANLKRGISQSLLRDFPLITVLSLLLLIGPSQNLTLGNIIIWTTLISGLKGVISNFQEISNLKIQKDAMEKLIKENSLSYKFGKETHQFSKQFSIEKTFNLLDGSSVQISTKPGLYKIQGTNGSGKSTLLDSIIGFNDSFEKWNPEDINILKNSLSNKVKIIEKNPEILVGLESLEKNICGPDTFFDRDQIIRKILQNLSQLEVSSSIIDEWEIVLRDFFHKGRKRFKNQFSSGEKVLLSFSRCFFNWTSDTSTLVMDECESFLDQGKRALFISTIFEITSKITVLTVSHVSDYGPGNASLTQETNSSLSKS